MQKFSCPRGLGANEVILLIDARESTGAREDPGPGQGYAAVRQWERPLISS